MGVITEELVELCGIRCHVLAPETFERELSAALSESEPTGWVCQKGTLTGGPEAPRVAFELKTSGFTLPRAGRYRPTITREEALREILPILNDGSTRPAVIATTGKLSRELYEIDDQQHDKGNRFYMVGSMGCAAGFGLGVARARKGKVVVLDGDGALLMKLGTVATIGATAQKNLHHVVIDNGAHDSTGGQPTVSPSMDTAAVALACGYLRADTVDSAADFRRVLESHLGDGGPTLLRMMVRPGGRKELGRPKLSPRDAYARFKAWLEATA
jgi:phosphonopyruvate decarboxylase